ncbi:GNAT family N-acetyltransferase [Salinicoccus sp. HZC-1]|uniref:GNAT family N-acetyltransferase n=1 Tax=Salinicoccus sp. HZC-1 TaxID=3385497 RepID=UPI00398AA2E1
MVKFIEITEENFYIVINLETHEYQQQQKFVAPNVRSLAECYLYRNDNDVFPYAVEANNKIVGFILIDIDEEKREFMVWRMMIDKNHQRRGYGRQTVEEAIRMASNSGKYDTLIADYVKGNERMGMLLRGLGFMDYNFDKENNEYVLHYDLNK